MIQFLIYVLTIVGIYGLLSLSLSLQFGQTGLANFGLVAFFMLGAYLSSIMTTLLGWPIVLGFVVACIGGGLLGVLMALPIGNLRQDYWAMVTLAAGELLRIIFLNTNLGSPYVGASFGVTNIPGPFRNVLSPDGFAYFYLGLVVVCVIVAYLLVVWVCRSPFGRVLKSVRESDEVAKALGKDVRRARIGSMAIGGVIAGAAGSLFAHFIGFINPTYFLPLETFLVWAMVILGGSGNHLGALLGAVIIEFIYNATRFLDVSTEFASTVAALRMVLIGVLIIVVILYLPRGLAPERRRRYASRRPARTPPPTPRERHVAGS